MGLDTVELVMKVEETFDITIPDADAEKILTVGDLYAYILLRWHDEGPETPGCLTAAAFYRLRRGLMRGLRLPRRAVQPRSLMEDLIPETNRRSEWQRLGESLGWRLPELIRPACVGSTFLGLLVCWLAIVIFAWARLAGFAFEAVLPMSLGFLTGAALMGVVVYRLTRPLAVHFASARVREMVPRILSMNFWKIRKDQAGWNQPEVWEVIKAIVAEQAGVSPDRITEATSFVYDLEMD